MRLKIKKEKEMKNWSNQFINRNHIFNIVLHNIVRTLKIVIGFLSYLDSFSTVRLPKIWKKNSNTTSIENTVHLECCSAGWRGAAEIEPMCKRGCLVTSCLSLSLYSSIKLNDSGINDGNDETVRWHQYTSWRSLWSPASTVLFLQFSRMNVIATTINYTFAFRNSVIFNCYLILFCITLHFSRGNRFNVARMSATEDWIWIGNPLPMAGWLAVSNFDKIQWKYPFLFSLWLRDIIEMHKIESHRL